MEPSLSLGFLANLDINMLMRGLIAYIFIIWFCIVVWVAKDINNRTRSVLLQIFCILIVLFLTPLGIFIYLLIRPQKTLFEKIFEEEFLKLDAEYKQEISPEQKKAHIHHKTPGIDIQKEKHHHNPQ
ncbi:MAG: hypothetical protein WC753_00265 [Candidatus Gracilibacteria bacterium]|jgi:ABC-type nickel/cobalt efflux system permease component RcnA